MTEIIEADLATKRDIEKLENALVQLEYRLVIKLSAVVVTTVTLAIAVTAAISKVI